MLYGSMPDIFLLAKMKKPKKKPRRRGRPRGRRLKFHIKLLPEIDKLARQRAATLGIPKSHYIEELIRQDGLAQSQ
jgi:hypothetical protein